MIKVIEDTLRVLKTDFRDHRINKFCKFSFNDPMIKEGESKANIEVEIRNQDSLDTAFELIMEGYKEKDITVLNMASWYNLGGGVLKGSKAQEEDICRRSNLLLDIGCGSKVLSKILKLEYDENLYPLKKDQLILSNQITVFKDSSYNLLSNPFKCNIITSAAIKNPILVKGKLNKEDRDITKKKISHIINIGLATGKVLVLGAYGCGAYHNPPYEIAEIFKEVISESNYSGKIVFAILDKKTTDGNLKPFQDVFNNK